MVRQGKYTRRVTPLKRAKWQARKAKGHFAWFRRLSWKKKILVIAVPILVFLITVPLLTYAYFARDIADKDRLMNRNNTGIVLYANDGKTEIYSSGRAEHRDLVPLNQISDDMKHALVASEDKNFYQHSGFSIGNMLAALYTDTITGSTSYGGSTLTQQLAKNTLLSNNKNFLRKFQELSIAIAIERTYSKDDILDMYLNSVYFGENAFGIQDAAKAYYGDGVTPDKLDLAQSAMLVGVLPAPSAYSPISGNPQYAKERQTTVLTRMVTNGYITEAQKQAALAEQLSYAPPKSAADSSPAPHFAQMVLQQLDDKYGEEVVTRSGYQVTTTLDLNLEKELKANIDDHMSYIQRNGGSNAGAIAIDPASGEIRALVGSADWNNPDWGKVNMATTKRQPGSSFKPLYYSEALATGVITPATIFEDEPTDFNGYKPQNASRTYSGPISVRNALSRSLNIPSVKVMQKLGVSKAVSAAQRMGVSTLDPNADYGLSLALGSAEVPLIEMTNAYAGFANGGQQYTPTSIKEIDTKFNEKVFTADEKAKTIISPEGAFLISSILSDNAARAPIFGSSLTVPGKTVAVKTGTTDDSRDAWTVGYTSQIAIGVWVGNNDNAIMRNGGSGMAGPIWLSTMKQALANTPNTPFTVPSGVVQRQVCSNGSLADSEVRDQTHAEYFLSTALPTERCSVSQPVQQPTEDEQSNSTTNTQTTTAADTTTSLSASPSSTAQFGKLVTLTATVSSSSSMLPAGSMTFLDGSQKLGTVTVINGTATFTTSSLLPGTHVLSAQFSPTDTDTYKSSTSLSLPYTITLTGSGGGSGSGNGNGNGNGSGGFGQ
jgi:1A family penicillin-binding protein